ncbi:GIY-YIG nuclease family protein, partial [Glaesserella parasuis]
MNAIPRTSGVYAITSPSGNVYIGSAVDFRRRWLLHVRQLKAQVHHCVPLQRAYEKYGLDALSFEILQCVPREGLIVAEQAHMDANRERLYNVCPNANSRLGRRQTLVTREKIRAAQLGRKRSEETKRKMAEAQV